VRLSEPALQHGLEIAGDRKPRGRPIRVARFARRSCGAFYLGNFPLCIRVAPMRGAFLVVGASVFALGLAFGCGGGAPPEAEAPPAAAEPPMPPAEPPPAPAEPPSTSAPEAAPDAGAPAEPAKPAWAEMNAAQRAEYMKTAVVPKMSELFKEWEPKEFAEGVNCVTCHGPNAKKGEFKMPNPKLPKINEAMMKKHPQAVKFMSEQVVPEMSKLLGVVPFDPATKTGFGCMNCHTPK
jgi:hypothetical protein